MRLGLHETRRHRLCDRYATRYNLAQCFLCATTSRDPAVFEGFERRRTGREQSIEFDDATWEQDMCHNMCGE